MKLISTLKTNKIFPSENKANKISKVFNGKFTFEKVTTFYEIANFFKLSNLTDALFCYLKRLFPLVSETENFLQLSFSVVAKILSSSSLHITSEMEVLQAVNYWLSHNYEVRRVFASDLLLKVRLRLIPKNSLKCLLRESSSLTKDGKCVKIISNILNEDSNYRLNNIAYGHRHCDEKMLNILICISRSDESY